MVNAKHDAALALWRQASLTQGPAPATDSVLANLNADDILSDAIVIRSNTHVAKASGIADRAEGQS